jgi:hypothetical protein
MPRLLHELAVARGDGSYTRLLARLAKLDLLAIDDWLLAPLHDGERRDLTEVVEDRSERASTLIATQVPAQDWHAGIGDLNQADAICDRLLHNAHRIELKGPSMRGTKVAPNPWTALRAAHRLHRPLQRISLNGKRRIIPAAQVNELRRGERLQRPKKA